VVTDIETYEQKRERLWQAFQQLGHGSRTAAVFDIAVKEGLKIVPATLSNVLNGRAKNTEVLEALERWLEAEDGGKAFKPRRFITKPNGD
jgi:hypothetical protein